MDAGCECAPWVRSANPSDSWVLVIGVIRSTSRLYLLHTATNSLRLSTDIVRNITLSDSVATRAVYYSNDSGSDLEGNCRGRVVAIASPHAVVWLGGVVVSALGMRTRGPRFESRVAPLFHWVATLGKLFTHIAFPVSQLQETGVQKGSLRRLSGYGD